MRKLQGREKAFLALLAIAAAFLLLRWWRGSATPVSSPSRAAHASPPPRIPRIDLGRLAASRVPAEAGQRNIFAFGSRADPEPAGPAAVASAPPVTLPPLPTPPPGPPPTPAAAPLNLKYIGTVDAAAGVRVAVLLTDKRETLYGQPGQLIANRYRIVHIGHESLDIEEVATGQARRLPLRAQ